MLIIIVAPIWLAVFGLASVWGASDAWLHTIGIVGGVTSFFSLLMWVGE